MVLFCRERGESLTITLHVQPRARKTEIVGVYGDAIKIKVAAPPVEGAANDELVAFFAEFFGVPKSAVDVLRGSKSRNKVVVVEGVTVAEFTELLIRQGLMTIKFG